MSSVFTQKYFKNFQSFFEKSIDKLKIVCYNILVKRLRDNRKIKEGKRKMTDEKKNEIIKIRKKFYKLFENIDLDEIALFAKWEIEKDLESLKKSREIARDLEEYSLYERLINNREKQLKEINEILQ